MNSAAPFIRPALVWLALLFGLLLQSPLATGSESAWVRGSITTNQPIWGLRGGLQFAIAPAGFGGSGPRGLIRLGYPVLPHGGYDLINFIAIEPVVNGRKGYSELERSRSDAIQGKRIWADDPVDSGAATTISPGTLSTPQRGVEQLDVILKVEKFDNGGHVRVRVSQRTDNPDEVQFTVTAEPDSAAMDYCILTATMGNKARARQLWLRGTTENSRRLYPDYRDTGFGPHKIYPLDRLHRTHTDDIIVAITTDEQDPASVFPFPGTRRWYYGGSKVTQYWKKSRGSFHDDLEAAVNARYTYWQSRQPIPGGVAFENFELREKFHPGQQFIFGITQMTPAQLGM